MKVKELILELQKFDPEDTIEIDAEDIRTNYYEVVKMYGVVWIQGLKRLL